MKLTDNLIPIKILHETGDRMTTEYAIRPEGLYFLETGWDQKSLNPFHFLPGEVTGEGSWKVGDIEIQEIKPGDPKYRFYEDWVQYKKEAKLTPEKCQKELDWSIKSIKDDEDVAGT